MNWQSETRAWAVASAAVLCLGSIGYRVWTSPKLPDLNPTVALVQQGAESWAASSKQQADSVVSIEKDLRAQLWHLDRVLNAATGTLNAGTGTLQAAMGAVNTANGQLSHVAPLLDAAKGAVASIPPAVKQITDKVPPLLTSANGAVTDLDRQINSPTIAATMANVQATSANVASITANADKITKDSADEVHALTHPPKKDFWQAVWAVVHATLPPFF